jgi:hypothetical protein
MTRKTIIIGAIAAGLLVLTLATIMLALVSWREHDEIAIVASGATAGLSLYALVWWIDAWIAQIRRRAAKGPPKSTESDAP